MITILEQPQVCSLTKNQMIFKVKTDMQYPTDRIFPKFQFTVLNKLVKADFIQFEFENPTTGKIERIKITATDELLNPGDIFSSTFTGGSVTTAQYVALCVLELRKINVFNAYYKIEAVGNTFIFTAKFAIAELIFRNFQKSSILISDDWNSAVFNDPDERPGYEMRADIYIEQTHLQGNYTLANSQYCPLDENSEMMIDVSDIVNADIEAAWSQIPVPATEIQQFIAPNLRRYYVKFIEIWEGESEYRGKASAVLYAHWGGISTDDENNDNPVSLISAHHDFLTWWPSGKRNFANQRDYLSWMNTGFKKDFNLKTVVYATDGTFVENVTTFNLNEFQTITFQTGYTFLQLQALLAPGKELFKYSFQIIDLDSEQALNEPYFFYKEKLPCLHKTLLYWNNFGVPETFVTTGVWIEKLVVSSEMANRGQQFNTSNLRPQNFVFSTKSQNSISATTQFLTQIELYRLQILLTSSLAFVMENGNWRPIIINASKEEILETNTFLALIKIEIIRANSTDRSSFYDASPKLIYTFADKLVNIKMERNGFVLASIGALTVIKDNAPAVNYPWDAVNKRFSFTPEPEVKYKAFTTVIDEDGNAHKLTISFVKYSDFLTYKTTDVTHTIYYGHDVLGYFTKIDWGVGGVPVEFSNNTVNPVTKTYANGQVKQVRILNTTINVTEFSNEPGCEILNPNFEALKYLKKLTIDDGVLAPKMYFNNLKNIENIELINMPIEVVELGSNLNLKRLVLTNLLLSPQEVERIITNLWNFRKAYNAWLLEIDLSNNVGTATAKTTAMLAGTGEYINEGLVADYNWTVTV